MYKSRTLPKFPAEKVHTSIGPVKCRVNNPTYSSTFMNASLCSLSPTSSYEKTLLKDTAYRSEFNKQLPSNSYHRGGISYHKSSYDAQLRQRSNLSSYGTNVLN